MSRVFVLALCAACAGGPEPLPPAQVPFAARLDSRPGEPAEPLRVSVAERVEPQATELDETRGLLQLPPSRLEWLRDLAADDARLDAALATPLARADLEALAWLRSPAVREARARLDAARTGYAQSADLADLVARYRSFLRETSTRVGPERSRRATERIAPVPNVNSLSAAIARAGIGVAEEELRIAVRSVVADVRRTHADALRLAAARRILEENVALHESLLAVLKSRFEAGRGTQAGVLALLGRLETLRTELTILADEAEVIRARWNALLHRPPAAPLATAAEQAEAEVVALDVRAAESRALQERQELRRARHEAERARLAVRLGEVLALPPLDPGWSRFERERVGEAGVQRGEVFPGPRQGPPPRADFGIRESQLHELRARRDQAAQAVERLDDATRAQARAACFDVSAEARRWALHRQELIPLAERALRSERGAYEGNRTGYLELLDSARELLRARLGAADARRAYAHARARLLEVVGVELESKR